jgi:hypothetical protein
MKPSRRPDADSRLSEDYPSAVRYLAPAGGNQGLTKSRCS